MSVKIIFADGTTATESLTTSTFDLIKHYVGKRIRVIRYL